MAKRTVDIGRLLQEVTDTLVQWDGDSIAEKSAEVLGHDIKYLGDSMFEIIEEEDN